MARNDHKQKVIVIGAGPVGALAGLYAANRGDDVNVYELRDGMKIERLFRLFIHSDLKPLRVPVFSYSRRINGVCFLFRQIRYGEMHCQQFRLAVLPS